MTIKYKIMASGLKIVSDRVSEVAVSMGKAHMKSYRNIKQLDK